MEGTAEGAWKERSSNSGRVRCWNVACALLVAQVACLFALLGSGVGGLFIPTAGGLFTQTALECESATRSRHVLAERAREERRQVGRRGEGANRRPGPPEGRSCPPRLGLVSAAALCRAPPFPQRPLASAWRPFPPTHVRAIQSARRDWVRGDPVARRGAHSPSCAGAAEASRGGDTPHAVPAIPCRWPRPRRRVPRGRPR